MVKPGYKQTEIGMIPEDWNIGMFKNVGEFFKGSGISMRDVKTTGFPCIMYGDIYVKFDTHFKKCDFRIDENTAKRSTQAISNDLFFTASGETAEEIGKCVSYQGEEDIFIGGDIIAIRPKKEYNSLFLSFVQNSSLLIKQKSALAQGHTVVHINRDSIASLVFAYPELTEQKRIAEALSDVDELISSLEKLIEKYKSVKATCLQQMFPQKGETTPKMRLPGFTGAWEQRKFEDIAVRSSAISSESGLPRVEYEDIISGIGRLNKDIFAKESDKSGMVFHKGDVLYGKLRPYLQNWLLPTFSGLAVGDFWVLQPQNADSSFLYRLVQSRQFDEVANQSTGTKMPRADWKLVSKTEFFIPSTIDEQAAIGTYFEQLDYLITLHQRKLDKAKKIKQGMMQQLLTGKIRLNN